MEHATEQKRRFRAVLKTKPRTFSQIGEERRKAEQAGTNIAIQTTNLVSDDEEEDKILDGFFLVISE